MDDDDATRPTPSALAGRWFDVRAHVRHLGPLGLAWLGLRTIVLDGISWGTLADTADPRRRCRLEITRRDTGAVVWSYGSTSFLHVDVHLRLLQQRLHEQQVFDFTRRLGLPWDAVAGPGTDVPRETKEPWISHTRREWRTLYGRGSSRS